MNLPKPRLGAIKPGQQFTLIHDEGRVRALIETDRHYGHFKNGRASLCHELDPVNLEWAAGGWRVASRRKDEESAEILDATGA